MQLLNVPLQPSAMYSELLQPVLPLLAVGSWGLSITMSVGKSPKPEPLDIPGGSTVFKIADDGPPRYVRHPYYAPLGTPHSLQRPASVVWPSLDNQDGDQRFLFPPLNVVMVSQLKGLLLAHY